MVLEEGVLPSGGLISGKRKSFELLRDNEHITF